jgi:hypothetical protein
MIGITITPNKILYSHFGERGKTLPPNQLHLHAWEPIQIKGDVSLKRLLSLLEDNLDIWEILLQENIKPFISELQKPYSRPTPIEWIEVFWEAIVDNVDDEKDFDMAPTICGKKKKITTEDLDSSEFGIGLAPLNNIAHLPVRLNTKVKVRVLTYKDDNIDVNVLDFGDRDFTVLEFLKALFMEIGFFGTPEKREEQLRLLMESVRQAREGETAPWGEVKKNIEERIRQRKNTLNLLGDSDDSTQNA